MNAAFKPKSVTILSRKGQQPTLEDHVSVNDKRGIFIVSDGFGGGSLGETASKSACGAVNEFLEKEAGDTDATLPFVLRKYYSLAGNVVFNAVWFANQKLCEANQGKPGSEKSGASITAAFIAGDTLALANVGAMTAWLIRGGQAVRLVTPRTYQMLVNPTDLSQGDSIPIPLMALGMTNDVEPEIIELKLKTGDWIVMNSGVISESLRGRFEELNKLSLISDQTLNQVGAVLESHNFDHNTSILLAIF